MNEQLDYRIVQFLGPGEADRDVPDTATIQRHGDNQFSDRFYAAEVTICGDELPSAILTPVALLAISSPAIFLDFRRGAFWA
jgi:hypothetical protein